MNITEFMSFDLDWFTTLPGLLITGGVIVLLIALIIFIASNKKAKNTKPEVGMVEDYGLNPTTDINNGAPVNNMVVEPNMAIDNNMMNNAIPSVDVNGFNSVNEVVSPVDNVNPMNNNVVNMNNGLNSGTMSVPVVNSPVVDIPTSTGASYDVPPVPTNVVDFSAPAQPSANNDVVSTVNNQPVVDVTMTAQGMPIAANPVVEQVLVPEVTPMPVNEPNVNVVPVEVPAVESTIQERPTIYGGIDPANTVSTTTVEKPVIYGGANPLENTTTIPKMTNHEVYGMESKSVVEIPAEPSVEIPAQPEIAVPTASIPEPQVSVTELPEAPSMPMTGADIFASKETITNGSSSQEASSEIETLEF